MLQPALSFGSDYSAPANKWQVPKESELPFLNGVTRVGLDTENSSRNAFDGYVCGVGLSWRDPDTLALKKLYTPVDHAEGNMDPDVVKAWLEYVLPGKELVFANGKYDIQILKTGSRKRGKFWLDLEALGVKPMDVAFPAALLDDNPYVDLSLEAIGKRYVGRGKLKTDLDMNNIANYPSWMVGPYGEEDPAITLESYEAMAPLIENENLDQVLELENSIIYAVCEIEKNGCRLDVEKLARWREEIREEYEKIIMQIRNHTGMLINPNGADDMARMFRHYDLKPPEKVEKKATKKKKGSDEDHPTKKKDSARTYEVNELLALKHPVFNMVVEARRRESLLSKFLDKYWDGLQGGDILRASFHQLKTTIQKGEKSKGTGWGRFSSSGGGDLKTGYSFNAQQVIRTDKQKAELGIDARIIRELFVPAPGSKHFAADAKQIEYRLLAHYSNARSIIKAYQEDPSTDYHQLVHDKLLVFRPDIDRTTVKNVNFAFGFGASERTLAATAGITIKESGLILQYCRSIFPEQDPFLKQCAFEAEHKGFVTTILGRRARFKKDDPFYKAISRIIQGSAADIFKCALRDIYKERHVLGITALRQIVHDEFNGDCDADPHSKNLIRNFLDQQRVKLKIPISWDIKTGNCWAECK